MESRKDVEFFKWTTHYMSDKVVAGGEQTHDEWLKKKPENYTFIDALSGLSSTSAAHAYSIERERLCMKKMFHTI